VGLMAVCVRSLRISTAEGRPPGGKKGGGQKPDRGWLAEAQWVTSVVPLGLCHSRTCLISLRTDAAMRSSMSPAQRKAGRPYS